MPVQNFLRVFIDSDPFFYDPCITSDHEPHQFHLIQQRGAPRGGLDSSYSKEYGAILI
jgi:hypothetical protein